jgi:GntR family transcriptional repressor for pyruvate dehydrogenase complex
LVSERDLAIQLGVGRPLVREALRALTMLGIVEIRDRIGTVVTRPDVSVLNDFFIFALAQQADMPDGSTWVRSKLENAKKAIVQVPEYSAINARVPTS